MTPKSKNWAVYLIFGGVLYLAVAYIIAHGCYAYAQGAECKNWFEGIQLGFEYLKSALKRLQTLGCRFYRFVV